MNQPALLPNRALLRIGGGDAEGFLQNLVTCDIEGLRPDALTLGALLTPQGKILFEFFLAREGDGFVIDIDASMRADFLKRLTFYKLRADVHLAPVDDAVAVLPGGDGSGASDRSRLGPRCFADPRHPDLGLRIWGHAEAYGAPSSAYHAR
ncbi:MAG: folate-binding protein, partial [Pseudomonadota bacterium]